MAEVLLEISGSEHCPLTKQELGEIATKTLQTSLKVGRKTYAFSAAFVPAGTIRKLNRIYRKKDKVTDVLSFGEYPNRKKIITSKNREIFLGELIISFSFVRKSAKISKVSFRREMAFVFVHGLLHLLGMEHGKKMFLVQDKLIQAIK